MQRTRRKRLTKTSPFISKLHEILEDSQNQHLIKWAQSPSAFIIHHPFAFSNKILPKYFRHKNYSSFLRQLNLYSFTKLRSEHCLQVFHHPLFQRGSFQKHKLIKRVDNQPQKYPSSSMTENENDSEALDYSIQANLQDKIGSIKNKQRYLRQSCQKLINENYQTISDNYIFKATLQDESSNDRIILDRISAFMMHHYEDGKLQYCDSAMIKGLLKFLDNNDWQDFFSKQTPNAIADFFRMIEDNQLKTAVKWVSSALGQRKKKNFTIITRNSNHQDYQKDVLSILD